MSDIVIRAEGLGKKYLIGHETKREQYTALRDVLSRTAKGFARSVLEMARGGQLIVGDEVEEFWALKDVSFEIKRGDVSGIVGRNGAGKSTLLKVLSRITEPTEGRVEIKGRVASLLEVGTGFHPELSGRENIYLNGAILGMTRAEIRRKFDEIVAFAEVERFLDTPVKHYSSGMYVRLAFAVAAHLEPEILIVDEVLAVGDAEFQKKCLGKMHDVAELGRTVLLVSHNMGVIASLCENGIFLSKGQVAAVGSIQEVLQRYQRDGLAKTSAISISQNIEVSCNYFRFSEEKSRSIEFSISLLLAKPERLKDLAILLYTTSGIRILIADLRGSLNLPANLSAGEHRITGFIYPICLVEQDYDVGLYLCTDHFSGNLMSLCSYQASPMRRSRAPYPAASRGFIEVETSASIL